MMGFACQALDPVYTLTLDVASGTADAISSYVDANKVQALSNQGSLMLCAVRKTPTVL